MGWCRAWLVAMLPACSFEVQRAVSNPGTLTQGVSTGRAGTTHGGAADRLVIVWPLLDRYA